MKPRIITGCLIFNSKNELFVAKGVKWSDMWIIPGGHLEYGESLEECVIREAKEETGLDVTDVRFHSWAEIISPPDFIDHKHFITFRYLCKAKNNHVTLNDEFTEYRWVSLDEAKTLKFPKDFQEVIANLSINK